MSVNTLRSGTSICSLICGTIVRKLFDFIKLFDSSKNSSLRTFQWVKPLFSLMQDCIIRIERLNKCIAHLFLGNEFALFYAAWIGVDTFCPNFTGCHLPFRFRFKSFEWIIFNFQQNIFEHTFFNLYTRFKTNHIWFLIWA